MNSKQQLVNKVETQENYKRLIRGQEIYNQNLISKLEGDIFLVKDRYIVENIGDIDPIYTCTCDDFTYRCDQYHNCKHIFAIILYQLDQ